jgi:ribosomal protein S18 acetylase RimI-like enzyme
VRRVTQTIRSFESRDFARVHDICVRAFTPIHEGFERELGPEIFEHQYSGWQERYADDLRKLTADPATMIHVVEDAGNVLAFVTTVVDPQRRFGEIGLNAVDPAHQGRGIGKTMYAFALESLKQRGADIAYVGTGADAAHAPARAAYEALGFDKAIPSIHYFRKL